MTKPLIGVQLGAHSVFDEGADHCLDLLQETAAVNTLFVYSHTYQDYARGRKANALAPDHGMPIKDPATRNLTMAWVEPHEAHYADTFLRHRRHPARQEYADRDVLAELIPPAHQRGMQVYARVLEGFGTELAREMPNWVKVLTVDVYGRLTNLPCWNNPAYQTWWCSTAADLFTHYRLDGFQFGAERAGPLSNLLYNHRFDYRGPTCFCEHCCARGRAQGIDVERARTGFRALYEFIEQLRADRTLRPNDGVQVTILRYLLQYPEILSWEMLWRQSVEDAARHIYGTIKTIRPEAQVGRHIDHQQSTWDLIFRAERGYDELTPYSDFIKPILYHDIAGPRIRHWHLDRSHETVSRELPLDESLGRFYAVRGYDPQQEPGLDQLDTTGLSPDYVYRETKRCVDSVAGAVPVYPGLGIDVPWGGDHFPSDPETAYQATLKAFEAGAGGIVISREYDEMRIPNLQAIGRAIRQVANP